MKVGSLFTGIGGLDLAVCSVFNAQVIWTSEVDAAARRVLRRHCRTVPDLGDVRFIDWSTVPPVDILCGGSPCQDMSLAGGQYGMADESRSDLWSHMAEAVKVLRPQYVVWENVEGARHVRGNAEGTLSGLGRVVRDLADLGYDSQWGTVRASDAGLPHARPRIFLLASPADLEGRGSSGQ